jgi:CRP-like cAMP-binding protein
MKTLAETRLARVGFLSEAERDVLSNIVLPTRVLRPGEDLIREDSWPLDIYPLIAGWAYRYITVRDEVRQTSALLIPGDICNLDNLLFDRADCGVEALTSATVLIFPREQALELTSSYPGIGRAFTWLALAENAILNQWAAGLGRRRPEERLAHLLCELRIRRAIAPDGDETSFEIPMDYLVIGDAIGLAPDIVRQTLEVFVQQGLIARAGNHVTVRHLERLQALASFNPSYLQQIEKSGYSRRADAFVEEAANTNDTSSAESRGHVPQSVDSRLADEKVSERDLVRREMFQSFKNDLQLIVGLLDLQSRRAEDQVGYKALRDAMERVETLTRARLAAEKDRHPTLSSALQNVCTALETHAQPRAVSFH